MEQVTTEFFSKEKQDRVWNRHSSMGYVEIFRPCPKRFTVQLKPKCAGGARWEDEAERTRAGGTMTVQGSHFLLLILCIGGFHPGGNTKPRC